MEFTGFRPEGLDLLIENRIQNSKAFYEAHKPQIKALVAEPFYALAERMTPVMQEIDPLMSLEPKKMLSRVRRDTRYSKDQSLYRDNAWLTFGRRKGDFASRPCFYFEITPTYWGYGCGYYHAPPQEMQIAREMMLQEDKNFLEAFRAVSRRPRFALYGELYKRPKFPDAPAAYQPWLNRKNLGVSCERLDHEVLWDAGFVEGVLDDLRAVAPLYHFMCVIKDRAQAGGEGV